MEFILKCKKLIICNLLRFPDKFITWLSLPTSLFWSAETLEWSSLGFNRAGEMTQLLMGPGDPPDRRESLSESYF